MVPGQRGLRTIDDRKNVSLWTRNVDARIADEVGCWKIGVQNEIKVLNNDGVFDNQEFNFE